MGSGSNTSHQNFDAIPRGLGPPTRAPPSVMHHLRRAARALAHSCPLGPQPPTSASQRRVPRTVGSLPAAAGETAPWWAASSACVASSFSLLGDGVVPHRRRGRPRAPRPAPAPSRPRQTSGVTSSLAVSPVSTGSYCSDTCCSVTRCALSGSDRARHWCAARAGGYWPRLAREDLERQLAERQVEQRDERHHDQHEHHHHDEVGDQLLAGSARRPCAARRRPAGRT